MREIQDAVGDIRTDDLLGPEELVHPTDATLFRLRQIAARANVDRLKDLRSFGDGQSKIVDVRSIGKGRVKDQHWQALSETSLFRRKRAEQLAPLLAAVKFFDEAGFREAPAAALYESLATSPGRKAISYVLTELRKRRLASRVADLAVCGAVAPYNELLGGKLIALLAASEEVRELYAERYADQPSEIASQLAGRRITRPTDLTVLTTTGLYGVGSSQYNRLRLRPRTDWDADWEFSWTELAGSVGYSVTHISRRTVELTRRLAIHVFGARRINSVFGEGSSPRVRQIREGLNLIGINNNHFLRHEVGRRVYACELYPSAREDLIGFVKRRRKPRAASVRLLTDAWVSRWFVPRCQSESVRRRLVWLGPDSVSAELKQRSDCARAEGWDEPDEVSGASVELLEDGFNECEQLSSSGVTGLDATL
jgi:hypothetical protein